MPTMPAAFQLSQLAFLHNRKIGAERIELSTPGLKARWASAL
jgi:hypothetical protein